MVDSQVKPHVRDDGHGDLRVGETDVPLESVIACWARGDSPESIRSQYPSMTTLRDVYGAISWMLDHPRETETYEKRQTALWEALRRECDARPSPVRDRLRALHLAQSAS